MNLVFDIETNGFMFEAEVKIPNEETKKIEIIETTLKIKSNEN